MAQKFANAARAVLASGIISSDTTITIVSGGSLFPEIVSPDFARAVLQDGSGIEIVLITAHTASADSFTVTRAQEGTTARSFAAGSVFGIRVTAADMDEALDAVNLATEVTGTLPIANGGTGQTTRQAAMDALAGAVTAGQYLRGDGTDVVMSAIQAADVPTLNQNTTGQAGSVANALTAGSFLTSAGTYNGAAARTFAVDATSTNTASKVVARDGSGNFSAGTITATLSGNASTATTAGTITSQANSATITAASTNTANQIVLRDASGNFSAGTITATLSGNASTATSATTATTATNQSGGTVNATTGAFSSTVSFPGGSGVNSAGDIVARRSNGTTGVYYFVTNGGSVYLYYDGTSFNFSGAAGLNVSGFVTATGNVTAYSDERVKTNWRGYGPDFIERLAKVKHGTFDRTDAELTQDGVSAQSLQELLPHSVMEGEDGRLSVAYGNAALVAAVKLAERVVALEARLAALESKG